MTVSQVGYLDDILRKFDMSNCNPVSTPMDPGLKLTKDDIDKERREQKFPYRALVGALMDFSTGTRPDIACAVSRLSQFNDCATEAHWKAAKRVLRYLRGTRNVGLVYVKTDNPSMIYTDADWGGCIVDRKSYTGFVFLTGGAAVSWGSKKQPTVALSSTEVEYMALSDATKEALYMRRLLRDFGVEVDCLTIRNDNVGAQKLADNPVFHARTKHVDIRHHFVRDAVQEEFVRIEHVPTQKMAADVLTKALSRTRHELCIEAIGLRCLDN